MPLSVLIFTLSPFDKYSGTLQEVAQQVVAEEQYFGWFTDNVDSGLEYKNIFDVDTEIFVRKWHEWKLASLIEVPPTLLEVDCLPSVDVIASEIAAYEKIAKLERRLTPRIGRSAGPFSKSDI